MASASSGVKVDTRWEGALLSLIMATHYYEWVFRATWRSTGTTIKVPGRNIEDATKRAESMIKRQLGGVYCQELKLIEVREAK